MEKLIALLKGEDDAVLSGGHAHGIGGGFQYFTIEYNLGRSWHPSLTGWPEHVLTSRQTGDAPRLPNGPMVRMGLSPFDSAAEAIDRWVWDRAASAGNSVTRQQELAVIVPDKRARITDVQWEHDILKVSVDRHVEASALELQVRWKASREGVAEVLPARHPEGTTEWQVPEDAVSVETFLVHDSGDLLGNVVVHTRGERVQPTAGRLSPDERAQVDLRTGERDDIEFKPFISPSDSKEEQLIATIVAFANTRGGRLYVGATDDGVPERRAALLKAAYEGTMRQPDRMERPSAPRGVDEALDLLSRRLRAQVTDKIKPVPDVHIQAITVFGERILLVEVAPGADRPYATHAHDVYIRKGASNRRPDPKTELPQLYPHPFDATS